MAIKFTIINVDDKRKQSVENIKTRLSQYQYIELPFKKPTLKSLSTLTVDSNFQLKLGELGVYLSNMLVWQYMIDNQIDKLLVLEDDAILTDNFTNIIDQLDFNINFNYISLFIPADQKSRCKKAHETPYKFLKNNYVTYGMVAMIYSLEGASKLLKQVKKEPIKQSIDLWLFKHFKGYCLNESIVLHDSCNDSLIRFSGFF